MGGLLSGNRSSRVNQLGPPDTTLRISTALQGRPRPLLYGQGRFAPNIFLATGFYGAIGPSGMTGVAGGKGGGGGGKGGGVSISWAWYYFCDLIFGFGAVPIINLPTIWNGQSVGMVNDFSCFYNNPNDASLSGVSINSLAGFDISVGTANGIGSPLTSPPGTVLFPGDFAQTPWAYMEGARPEMSLAYRGEAYLAYQNMPLGQQSSIPTLNFEYVSKISFDIPGFAPDANPKDVVLDYLTDPDHGVPSFRAAWLDDLTNYRDYCRAAGLLISPTESETRAAQAFLADVAKFTNANFRWSSGKLSIIPYGEQNVTGNGTTWVAPVTPVYGFTADDFLPSESSSNGAPVAIKRQPRSQMVNHLRMEYLDRAWFYNPEVIDLYDEASIDTYGIERVSDLHQAHMFALASAARTSASLLLQRAQIASTYTWTAGRRFILLDPMDIVTLTEPTLGLVGLPVRIVEMQENSDGSITFTAEEFQGTVTAPTYGAQTTNGMIVNLNASPGAINEPIIFEPPDVISNGLDVWVGVSGQDPDRWGGADVFVSYDGVSFAFVGTVRGPARMGVLRDALPSVAPAPSGSTVDTTNPLKVDLTESRGALESGSAADLTAMNLLTYVGGELVAFQNADLVATSQYDLHPLVRGAHQSAIAAHAAGTPFLRLDDNVLQIPFTQDRIGATISIKFRSFNKWSQGQSDLASAPEFQYTITGAALSSALPNVTNLRTVFADGFMQIWWDDIEDFRTGIRYKITKGSTFNGSIPVGDVAHPPFAAFGNDTYWITAYCSPISGLVVQSESPPSISISGNMLVQNLLQTTDEKAVDWPGTLTGLTASGGPGAKILSCTTASGVYQISDSHVINVGRPANVAINAVWAATGVPAGQNVLAMSDFLGNPDIFGAAAAAFINSWVEISTAVNDPGVDVFAAADAYAMADLFRAGSSGWSAWQKFVPGTYYGQYFRLRVVVENGNPAQVTGVITGFSYTVSAPPRVDHYQDLSIAAGGTTITFRPDNAAAPAPFNGGPNGSTVPYVNASWQNQPGDQLVISGLTGAGMTVLILNGGVGVARSKFNVNVEGY